MRAKLARVLGFNVPIHSLLGILTQVSDLESVGQPHDGSFRAWLVTPWKGGLGSMNEPTTAGRWIVFHEGLRNND